VYPDGGLQDGFFGNFVCLQIQTDPLLQTVRLAFPAIFPDNQCLRPQGRSVTSTTAGKPQRPRGGRRGSMAKEGKNIEKARAQVEKRFSKKSSTPSLTRPST
jgi:hypothetical protein